MTIQMQAAEQYFPVVLFIMLCKVFKPLSLYMESSSVTIQMQAIGHYFPVVLFIMSSTCPQGKRKRGSPKTTGDAPP